VKHWIRLPGAIELRCAKAFQAMVAKFQARVLTSDE
jgi:hypothetical protein